MNANELHERWVAAIKALDEHESDCASCRVDRYCDEGVRMAVIEISVHWMLTHPSEART